MTEEQQIPDFEDDDYFDMDGEEEKLDDDCPYCGAEYDEIDREYQICSKCGFNNNNKHL